MKKLLAIILVLTALALALTGCNIGTQSERVSHNVSKEAENFNITRRLAVINVRTDKPIFELVGNFSIENSAYSELEIIVETGPNTYKKHFVYLNEWTNYVVEDISGANVDPYHYEVNFLPDTFFPYTVTVGD